MAKCRACLHYEMCAVRHKDDDSLCCYFKDRSRYVVREKGEWETHNQIDSVYYCSECKLNVSGFEKRWINFCPYCGADMRKRENG